MRVALALISAAALTSSTFAAVTSTTVHGPTSMSLNGSIAVGDVISGLQAQVLAGGFHGAVSDPADMVPAFTDDIGIRDTGLTGLLRDFPGAGVPAIALLYDLPGPTNIEEIRVLTGNNGNDGRVFSTFTLWTSIDHGNSFGLLGYFQSDPSGTINANQLWGSTLVTVFDNASSVLAGAVTNLRIDLYSVDNTQNQMRDPYDGVNPFTGVDDGLTAAFVSPLVFEIDVIGTVIPEPTSAGLLALGLTAIAAAWRRRNRS